MTDGELVIRFFGMKDSDSTLEIAANVSRGINAHNNLTLTPMCLAVVQIGPFCLKNKKTLKAKSIPKKLKKEVKQMKVHAGFWKLHQVSP